VLPHVTLPYNGLTLDRAGSRRTDPDWVAATSEHASALALWRDGDQGVFAVDLSDMDEPAALREVGADEVVDVRRLFAGLTREQAATLAYCSPTSTRRPR
jgi:NAD+ diphosphatase